MSLKNRTKKRIFLIVAVIIVMAIVIAASRLVYMKVQGNFHTVAEGELYRSAQLDQGVLKRYINQYGIRTIINLRGKQPDENWYINEMEVCNKYNVSHYDLRLSATSAPGKNKIEELILLFKTAQKPILIHCKAGADRVGIASAIWDLAIDGKPKSIADKQLSFKYGHMPLGPTQVLDSFFAQWNPPLLNDKLKYKNPATQ